MDALQEPELLDLAFRDLEAYLGGSRRSYLKQPGITPGQVRKLFQSAAELYQLAPWLDFSDRMLFELDGREAPGGHRRAEAGRGLESSAGGPASSHEGAPGYPDPDFTAPRLKHARACGSHAGRLVWLL